MNFLFEVGHRIQGDRLHLDLTHQVAAEPERGRPISCEWQIVESARQTVVGRLRTRFGYNNTVVFYAGHIGFEIGLKHRGQGFAAQACFLTKEIFQRYGMDVIWVTCNPDNLASSRTCQKFGCVYVETVAVPPDSEFYQRGELYKKRYRWTLSP